MCLTRSKSHVFARHRNKYTMSERFDVLISIFLAENNYKTVVKNQLLYIFTVLLEEQYFVSLDFKHIFCIYSSVKTMIFGQLKLLILFF